MTTILAIYIWTDQKDLDIFNVNWECKNQECKIAFVIENKTYNSLPIKISMRAHRLEYIHGSDAEVSRLVGERIIEDELKPNEIKQYEELLRTTTKKVHLLKVNAWSQ